MKVLIILLTSIFLASCGKNGESLVIYKNTAKKVYEESVVSNFTGNWFNTNYEGGESFVSIVLTSDDLIRIEYSGQLLSSINPIDNTLSNHPYLNYTNLLIQDGKIRLLNKRYNYNTTSNGIKEDVSGNDISGLRRTDIYIEKPNTDTLRITINIYDKDINKSDNKVVAKRIFNLN